MPFGLLDRWRAPAPDPRKIAWLAAQDYAHRGLHGARLPENSLAAVRAARDEGLGVEIDVRRSGDGQPVVFHDETLDRLTDETGPLARRSAAQLGAIALAGTDQTIATLRQVLGVIEGAVPVLIEVKSSGDRHIAALCLAVRRILEGYTGPHAVMSFDPAVSRWYWRHSRHTPRGLIVSEGEDRALLGNLRRRLRLWHARPDFLAYDIRDLPSGFAARQRRRGLPVVAWTLRTPEHHERAARFADTGIFERRRADSEPEAGARR